MTLATLIGIILIGTLFILGNILSFKKMFLELYVNGFHAIIIALTLLLDFCLIIYGFVYFFSWASTIQVW